jgi:hypothetical protein
MPHPFYQTMSYRLHMSPTGSGVPHGPIPHIFLPRTPAPRTPYTGAPRVDGGEMTEGVREQITRMLREWFLTERACSSLSQTVPRVFQHDSLSMGL